MQPVEDLFPHAMPQTPAPGTPDNGQLSSDVVHTETDCSMDHEPKEIAAPGEEI
jgi:hypothetical protein